MNQIIVEHKNGDTSMLNPIGLKQFATAIDTPERVRIDNSGGRITIDFLPKPEHEDTKPFMVGDTKYIIGTTSGVVNEVSSGATIQEINDQAKSKILRELKKNSIRIQRNLDASLAVIRQVSQTKPKITSNYGKLNVMTKYEEFMGSNEWNFVELLHMCETVYTGNNVAPFDLLPANNSIENVILVYTPTRDALILKPKARAEFISKVENQFCQGESYDSYLNFKIALLGEN